MFVWVIERTEYETEGCPEHSSSVEEIVMGGDECDVMERAQAREEELQASAYALTEYHSYPVVTLIQV